MFISIILPNYNHAPFLSQRIESILNQSFKNFELIILDDFSTDESLEVIERYRQHSKVSHIVFNEQNSGSTFRQWQKGIDLARGDWIWIAESDDWSESSFLSACIERINCDKSIGICYTASAPVDHLGNRISDKVLATPFDHFITSEENRHYARSGQEEIKQKLVYKNFMPNASAVLFKKELFVKAVRQNCTYKYIADWWVWYLILQHTNVCFISEPLNYFRFHKSTTRSSSKKRINSFVERYHMLKQFSKDGYLQSNDLYYDRLFYSLYAEMTGLSTIQKLSILYKIYPYDKKIFKRLAHSIFSQLKRL